MIKSVSKVYDEFLGIQTEFEENEPVRCAPTDYENLERLFKIYPFTANDHFIDFGCGKGRVLIMAAYYSCKHITGYELNIEKYNILLKNIENYRYKFKNDSLFSTFNMNVEEAKIDDTANKLFFYNPFHLKVYVKVMIEIQASLQRCKRDVYIFLHRPMHDTVQYIDSLDEFEKVDVYERYKVSSTIPRFPELVVFSAKQ